MANAEQRAERVKKAVREEYAKIARGESSACCGSACGGANPEISRQLGYSDQDLGAVPEGANLGLGCGNPQAIAGLRSGEQVLDLGSGGGFDAFLAARQVGASGHVIGVDMTPDMVTRARTNREKLGLDNVDFRLGEIEHLPVEDNSIDVILSNCVINLSPDKPRVFREAFRVLKPGGRLAISDVIELEPMPPALRQDTLALVGCLAGAAPRQELEAMLKAAGFEQVRITLRPGSRELVSQWFPDKGAEDYVASATLEAVKPSTSGASAGSEAAAASSARSCCAPSCCGGET